MIGILDQMQILDQQVPPSWPVTQQSSDLGLRGGIDLPSLRRRLGTFATLARVLETLARCCWRSCSTFQSRALDACARSSTGSPHISGDSFSHLNELLPICTWQTGY